MPINIKYNLPQSYVTSPPLGKTESGFADKEVDSILKMRLVVKSHHETGEFISPIFVRNKSEGGFRLILNFKKLNEHVHYQRFKMNTLSSIPCLIWPNDYIVKIDIKDAYYSIPILEQHQKLLKFVDKNCLYNLQLSLMDTQWDQRN